MGTSFRIPDFGAARWREMPENPLIGKHKEKNAVVGDPQVLLPGEHDGQWHMFFHSFGFAGSDGKKRDGLWHMVSPDGIRWTRQSNWEEGIAMHCMFRDGDRWIMYYTSVEPQVRAKGVSTNIRAKTTRDFVNWSEPVDIIWPESAQEREGKKIQARNPCMTRLPDGRYRLYYSAGTVWLDDCGFEEPKYIFCAQATNPLGPFQKTGEPILRPDAGMPHRNHGCGGIKVYGWGKSFLAFYNPIYIDTEGRSRSEIRMLASDDGLAWMEAPSNPIIVPSNDGGWRSGIVYQLDAVCWQNTVRMYFNARDSWKGGIERIGCCVMEFDEGLEDLRLRKLI